MNEFFSIKRFWTLLLGTFRENKYRDLRVALIAMGIIFFMTFFGFFAGTMNSYSPLCFPIFCVAWFVAGTTFKRLASQSSSISYMMMPASSMEKTVATIIYAQLYMLIILMVSGLIGYLMGHYVVGVINVSQAHQSLLSISRPEIMMDDFGIRLLFGSSFLAVSMFGSVYFRKLAIVKTLLVLGAYGFVLFLAESITTFLVLQHVSTPVVGNGWFIGQDMSKCLFITMMVVGMVFFWFMTYLRHRETEV